MSAPHSVTTVDTEHCGRCETMESRLRGEEESVCARVCVSEFVIVG